MTITKEQIEAARKAAPVHLGPALDSTIAAVGEAIMRGKPAAPKGIQDLISRLRAVQNGAYSVYAASVAQEAADTLIALSEQPVPQPVAVKPLEWIAEDNGDFIAQSPVGWYHIGLPYQWWNLTMPSGEVPSFRDLDDAKAAAQADYDRRILSALTTQPADEWTKVVSRLTQERDEARERIVLLTRTFRAQNERLRFALLDSMELQERAREESRAKGYFRKLIDALKGDA